MLRIKQKEPGMLSPSAALSMTQDPPLQPLERKLEDIPVFMRKPMPMDFPDNSHLPEPENAIREIFHGTPTEIALEFKDKGNKHFNARRWWHAREAYIEAVEFWPDDPSLMEVLWLNIAAANIELGKSDLNLNRVHYGFVIILPKPTNVAPDTFPYFSPALPEDPTKSPLFCNVTLKYVERNAMDILVGVKTEDPIGPLLSRCLPGSRPTGWNSGVSFDPALKGKRQVEKLKRQLAKQDGSEENTHPTWDPNDDYIPSNISLYIETYRRQAVELSPESTLAEIGGKVANSVSDAHDGVCLEQGTIFINVFRRGSKIEKLWKAGKGRKGFALTQPQYRKSSKEELLAAGQLRTFIIGAPRDHL
ncbi:40S ribosomal protein, partial [Ceratobasidium sp. 392]